MDRPRRTSRSTSVSSIASSSVPATTDSPAPLNGGASAFPRGDDVDDDDDDGMSDEVRTAIAALGIMKRGASMTGTAMPAPQQSQPRGAGPPDAGSRSVSTASSSSFSWGGATQDTSTATNNSNSTAASSPVVPGSEQGDRDEYFAAAAAPAGAGAGHSQQQPQPGDPNFISRVSQLPVISGGLEWYGKAKDSSRVVKYGAGLVESSFSAVSRPIANNLQPSLGQLDDFACRQLDRLGRSPIDAQPLDLPDVTTSLGNGHGDRKRAASTSASHGRDTSMAGEGEYFGRNAAGQQDQASDGQQQAVAIVPGSRSRWQTVLLEAGGLGAAVSEESLKSLRYCLQWLLYATAHLDHQINTLRDFIISLQRHSREGSSSSDALVTASASAHLSQIKHDVVETIRKVVDVVSKYAGVALPEQAKRYVRQSILSLPVKWASAIGERSRDGRGQSVGAASDASTPRAERMEDPYTTGSSTGGGEDQVATRSSALGPTEDAAERVLTFAVEGLDTLRAVTSIFGESIQKAEDWIERLRIIGLDRQRQRDREDASMMPPPPEDYSAAAAAGTKRRRAAIARDDGDEAMSTGVEISASNTNITMAAGDDEDEGMTRRRKGPRSRESTSFA